MKREEQRNCLLNNTFLLYQHICQITPFTSVYFLKQRDEKNKKKKRLEDRTKEGNKKAEN